MIGLSIKTFFLLNSVQWHIRIEYNKSREKKKVQSYSQHTVWIQMVVT